MNKKIIVSIGVIGVAAAAVIGGTIAYFNDTETSTGNIFTAGNINLKVDHYFQSYNGNECAEYCVVPEEPVNLVSNGGFENPEVTNSAQWEIFPSGTTGLVWEVEWEGGSGTYQGETRPDPALAEYHEGVLGSAYEGKQYAELDSDWFGPQDPLNNEPASVRIWQDISTVAGGVYQVSFAFAPRPNTDSGENQLEFVWDGTVKAIVSDSAGSGPIDWDVKTYEVTASGATTRIEFADKGDANSLGTFIDDVKVYEMDCDYSIIGGTCELWDETNIDEQSFFNFEDVKPGDFGRNVISMHVSDNDAWTCLIVDSIDDEENQAVDPEIEAGDDESLEGELGEYLQIFAWADKDYDALYDPNEGEYPFDGVESLSDVVNLALHDPTTGNGVLSATTTEYIGLAWCAGTITVQQDGGIDCDGSTMEDDAQTDKLTADLTLYATQWRNNPTFRCADVDLHPAVVSY